MITLIWSKCLLRINSDSENGIVNPEMAGKAWVSLTATTNDNKYGAFQILKWTFKEVP